MVYRRKGDEESLNHYAQQFLWAKRQNWSLLLAYTIWMEGKPLQGRPVEFMLCYNNGTVLPAVNFWEITVIILQLWEIPYRESVWTNIQLSRHVGETGCSCDEGRHGLTLDNKIRAKFCRISGNFRALIEVLVYKIVSWCLYTFCWPCTEEGVSQHDCWRACQPELMSGCSAVSHSFLAHCQQPRWAIYWAQYRAKFTRTNYALIYRELLSMWPQLRLSLY